MIAVKFNIIIPINIFTVSILTVLDIPGLFMLLISMMFMFS